MDLKGYEAYFNGELKDYEFPQSELEKNLEEIKDYPKPSTTKSTASAKSDSKPAKTSASTGSKGS